MIGSILTLDSYNCDFYDFFHTLSFKVGIGKVIRGWDEALLTMNKGEKARLEIEPEWAYGKKGQPDAKIPPNAKLIFEVELVDID
ncbi:Peptidyl-prolyl cis-trans isomerase FKBP3 [Camelus dromedarius]|uniref:peptidylprolyl isomerase n=1 Tax=Camelus dromedarius TaxID=9838 RepID=A0A5N4EBF4_CAMDR|nr:Peptidyl-prolyl cis-trans isomerase FKBP3 [Camelus dromedarius]